MIISLLVLAVLTLVACGVGIADSVHNVIEKGTEFNNIVMSILMTVLCLAGITLALTIIIGVVVC